MKTRVTIAAALMAGAALSASAWQLPSLPYEDMVAKSDLVVIARPFSSRDTGERKSDSNVNPPVPVAGVITECQALYVFKGPRLKRFKFHHFRDLTDPNRIVVGGPVGTSFDLPKNRRYLMFLVREAGGRFVPLAGHTHVEDVSVQEVIGTSID